MRKITIRKLKNESCLRVNYHTLSDVLQSLTQAQQWCCEGEELSKRIETAMYSVANELCNMIEKDYLPEKEKRKFSVKTESSVTLEAQDEEEATKKVYNSMMKQANKNGLNIKDWDIKAKEA